VVVVAPAVVEVVEDGAVVVVVPPGEAVVVVVAPAVVEVVVEVDDVVWAPAAAGVKIKTKRDRRKRRGARGSVLMRASVTPEGPGIAAPLGGFRLAAPD